MPANGAQMQISEYIARVQFEACDPASGGLLEPSSFGERCRLAKVPLRGWRRCGHRPLLIAVPLPPAEVARQLQLSPGVRFPDPRLAQAANLIQSGRFRLLSLD